jgi:hypothetical protein
MPVTSPRVRSRAVTDESRRWTMLSGLNGIMSKRTDGPMDGFFNHMPCVLAWCCINQRHSQRFYI